ncbi:hypothetical protein C5S31_02285 [ANME-1 cluster archaeon GoMg2]|nr:hypothetical protein [ANME-1 cluster archaeon GoMg2]
MLELTFQIQSKSDKEEDALNREKMIFIASNEVESAQKWMPGGGGEAWAKNEGTDKTKEDGASKYAAWAITNNFDTLIDGVRDLLFKLSEKDKAARLKMLPISEILK